MGNKYRFVSGLVVIALGLLLNKWVVEKFTADANIQSLSYIVQIVITQAILILYGIYLIINKTLLKSLAISLLIAVLALSVINGANFFNLQGPSKQATQTTAQIVLDRVIALENNKVAKLSWETGEILYSLHQNTMSVTFQIPPGGVLDTAIGVDPLITNLFTGRIYFELAIVLYDREQEVIFRSDIELSSRSGKDYIWRNVRLDLSEYSGREITLNFRKGYQIDDQRKPKTIYDLLPIDLMYWRAPNVRPKRLKDKYNVIFISLDTLRADHLHFMGYSRETSPNLDRLAQNGVYFTTVVSQSPWTAPSHFSIFTSKYPVTRYVNNKPFVIPHQQVRDGTIPTIASILKNKGYVTAAFTGGGGVSALYSFYKGYDFYKEISDANITCGDAEVTFNSAMQWLNGNQDRTFFLFIHTYEPHIPYCDEYFVRREKISVSETLEYRKAKYDGDIRRADFFVGKLIEKLDELRLLDNTMIVITSDHGEDLGDRTPPKPITEHGQNLYDEQLLVPLIIYNTEIIPRGKRIDQQVRLIDIVPTIVEYLGYTEEATFEGRSLKGMIGGNDEQSRPAYSGATIMGTERESMRVDGYKYIYRISYGKLSNPNFPALPLTPLHELYDLDQDPDERVNIAEKEKGLVKEFQKLIASLLPGKKFKDRVRETASGSVYRNVEEEELKKSLKALGYIQ